MLGRIYAIALNTFREAIRSKVLYGILAVVAGMNLFALVLGQMSLHQEARVARDVGLAGVSLFGNITAIVLGVSLLYAEIQKRTIHNILSKPVERHEFVLGKYLGMAMTLTILVALFTLAMWGMLLLASAMTPYGDVDFTQGLFRAVLLAYFEVLVVAAIAIFFSSFSTPFLSGTFTFAVFFLGRASEELRAAAQGAKDELIRGTANMALKIVPDLHLFYISGGEVDGQHVSVHGLFVGWEYVTQTAVYGLLWIAGLLAVAMVIFRRRDFV